jgi:uncharacterized protein
MSAELDRVFDPRALAARNWKLSVETRLAQWPRLSAVDDAVLASSGGGADRKVSIEVALWEDERGVARLEAALDFAVRCVCQRCLEVMDLDVHARPKLFFGGADELDKGALAAGYEHCELEPGATLRQLLEDEALLSIPVFPVHERSDECGALAAKLAELKPAEGGDKSSSPFAVLAELKRKD